jgi:hypothetical protein
MSHVVTLEFGANEAVSGTGFRLVAEEVTAGCGGILHGMVSSTVYNTLYCSPDPGDLPSDPTFPTTGS